MKDEFVVRVVDDDKDALEAVCFMIACEGFDVRTYSSAMDFLHDDMPSMPGCVILDVRMPDMSGLELFEELRKRRYEQPVIFLSGHGDIEMAVEALHEGASDFLVKPVNGDKLISAIKKVHASIADERMGLRDEKSLKLKWDGLTEREKEIARYVAEGWMNKTIACEFGISVRTVEVHRARALQKIGLHDSAQIKRFLEIVEQDKFNQY